MTKHMKRLFPLLLFTLIMVACGGGEETTSESPADKPAAETPAAANIDTDRIWKIRCVACHGLNGDMGTNGAANLKEATSDLAYRINIITNGSENGVMTAFGKILTPEEIEAMAKHTMAFNPNL